MFLKAEAVAAKATTCSSRTSPMEAARAHLRAEAVRPARIRMQSARVRCGGWGSSGSRSEIRLRRFRSRFRSLKLHNPRTKCPSTSKKTTRHQPHRRLCAWHPPGGEGRPRLCPSCQSRCRAKGRRCPPPRHLQFRQCPHCLRRRRYLHSQACARRPVCPLRLRCQHCRGSRVVCGMPQVAARRGSGRWHWMTCLPRTSRDRRSQATPAERPQERRLLW
mmetsp:Transcript_69296/g.225769  ORF Transcript_69296/g.225769 Transcript_69296/m.225769 type:complete len:219 (-) Transcript_69296:458-1114(-)